MGFTTTEKLDKLKKSKTHSNPIKEHDSKLNKNEFYSFLQNLNLKTEIGLE